ncbi:MAG: hypothetical protein ACUVXA_09460 [Candidatus Jordarchaeum sp.]|uniref:hypothetical protein n=1 Tax=Candidatus Jordarchaeum sp. TaxID=2823881 RepID=UPI0040499C1D
MKRLLEALNVDQNRAAEYFEIIQTVSNLYTKDVFEIRGLTKEDETTWIYRFKNVPCYEGTKKAGILDLYECVCYKRAEGWAEACGLKAEVYIRKSLVNGDDECEVVFSINKDK